MFIRQIEQSQRFFCKSWQDQKPLKLFFFILFWDFFHLPKKQNINFNSKISARFARLPWNTLTWHNHQWIELRKIFIRVNGHVWISYEFKLSHKKYFFRSQSSWRKRTQNEWYSFSFRTDFNLLFWVFSLRFVIRNSGKYWVSWIQSKLLVWAVRVCSLKTSGSEHQIIEYFVII